jgi:hypothetical protein
MDSPEWLNVLSEMPQRRGTQSFSAHCDCVSAAARAATLADSTTSSEGVSADTKREGGATAMPCASRRMGGAA